MPLRRVSRIADGRWGTVLAAVAVALVSAAVVFAVARRRPPPPPPPAEAQVPAVAPPEPQVAPPPDRTAARARLGAARASVTCGGAVGEAVFVAPEVALAAIACPPGHAQVRLADGRELLGRVQPGAPAGTSVVGIPGAAAAFAPPGSAVSLADGAPLVVAIEGAGPGTLGEATARGISPVDGRPMLRVEEAGGPVAGPVADEGGNVVGVAPSPVADPSRPGLAVPVEAFAGALGREVPAAWGPAVERAADEDRRALGELWNRIRDRTVLLAATPGPSGVALVTVRGSAGRPPAEGIRLAVAPAPRDCNPSGRIVDWRTGPRSMDGLPVPAEVAAKVARITPPAGGGAVWIGTGVAQLDCDPGGVAAGATLSIPGTDPLTPVPFPFGQASPPPPEPPPPAPPRDDGRAAAEAAEEAAAFELGWRQAFQEANQRVAQARQHRLDLQAQREEARGNLQYALEQQLDGDVEAAKLEERRAQEALDDLDRRASLAAVPRAWRRSE